MKKILALNVLIDIILIYLNVWLNHMHAVWQNFWWYDTTFALSAVALVVSIIATIAFLTELAN
jgi:hypothetical protein